VRAFFESEQAWIQGLLSNAASPELEGHKDAKFRAVFISDIHLGTQGCQIAP
jgi:DNA polymerase II small subunit/DNA polymerase delta subunit B